VPSGAGKRRLSGKHLVGDNSQTVDIGTRVERLADALLGRHVKGRAHDGPDPREIYAARSVAPEFRFVYRGGARRFAKHQRAIAVVEILGSFVRLKSLVKQGGCFGVV